MSTWYRPPDSPVSLFNEFEELVRKIDTVTRNFSSWVILTLIFCQIRQYLMLLNYNILDIYGLDQLITEPTIIFFIISYLFYLPHDYNNYKEMPKKNVGRNGERPKGNYRAYVN